jgi:hypothetical protein
LRKPEELCGISIPTRLTSNKWLTYGILPTNSALSVILEGFLDSKALKKLITIEKSGRSGMRNESP